MAKRTVPLVWQTIIRIMNCRTLCRGRVRASELNDDAVGAVTYVAIKRVREDYDEICFFFFFVHKASDPKL